MPQGFPALTLSRGPSRTERHRRERVVGDCDGVENEGNAEAQPREERRSERHSPDPRLAAVAAVEASADVSRHERRERVAHDEDGHDGPSPLVQHAGDCDENHEKHQEAQLEARPQEGRERCEVARGAEDIPVHELPPWVGVGCGWVVGERG